MNIESIRKVKNTSKTPERYAVKVSNREKELQYMSRLYGHERYKGTPFISPSDWAKVLSALIAFEKAGCVSTTKKEAEDEKHRKIMEKRWDLR